MSEAIAKMSFETQDEDLSLLTQSVEGFVSQVSPPSAFRARRDSGAIQQARGFDEDLWASMAQMGLMGVCLPQANGGTAMGLRAAGVIAQALGQNLADSPFLTSAVMAVEALKAADDAHLDIIGPEIAAGTLSVALGIDEGAKHRDANFATTAMAQGNGFVLSGSKTHVVHGNDADLLLVATQHQGKTALFLVSPKAPGVHSVRCSNLDGQSVCNVTFDQVQVDGDALLGTLENGQAVLDRTLQAGRAVLAAEQLGGAAAVAGTTWDYLKTRKQFGRTIGSFQALQHRAADLYCQLAETRSLVVAALVALDHGAANAAQLSHAAKAKVAKTSQRAMEEAVQMHGGIGMTDALDLGLYMKRDRAQTEFLGDANFHAEALLRLKGL